MTDVGSATFRAFQVLPGGVFRIDPTYIAGVLAGHPERALLSPHWVHSIGVAIERRVSADSEHLLPPCQPKGGQPWDY